MEINRGTRQTCSVAAKLARDPGNTVRQIYLIIVHRGQALLPQLAFADQPPGLWRKLTASRFQLLMVLIARVRSTSSSSLKQARAWA